MKKQNEGFALPYVVVVILVLCMLSFSLMSVTLRNFQAQQATLTRMQDRYTAEGQIERFVSILEEQGEALAGDGRESDAQSAFVSTISSAITQLNSVAQPFTGPESIAPASSYTLDIKSTAGTAVIDAQIKVDLVVLETPSVTTDPNDPTQTITTYQYSVTDVSISYNSYQASSAEPEGGGEPT